MSYKFNIDNVVTDKKTGELYVITDRWKINGSARYECREYFVSFDEIFLAYPDAKIFKEDDLERIIDIDEECAKEDPVQSGGPIAALLLGDIVITRDGKKNVYIPPQPHWQNWIDTIEKGVLIDENNVWINIKDYDPQTLTITPGKYDEFDIMEIWRPESFLKIRDFDYKGDIRDTGTLIWARQDQGKYSHFTYSFNKDSIDIFRKIFGSDWIDEVGKRVFGEKYRNALVGMEINETKIITFYVRD